MSAPIFPSVGLAGTAVVTVFLQAIVSDIINLEATVVETINLLANVVE